MCSTSMRGSSTQSVQVSTRLLHVSGPGSIQCVQPVWEVHLPRMCRLVPDFFTCLAQGAFNVFNQYERFIYPECAGSYQTSSRVWPREHSMCSTSMRGSSTQNVQVSTRLLHVSGPGSVQCVQPVWEVHLPRVCRLVPDFFTCLAQGAFNVFNQYERFIYPECAG